MTYRDIAQKIAEMTEFQKDNDAAVHIQYYNEYIPIIRMDESEEENDVFDEGHPYFVCIV